MAVAEGLSVDVEAYWGAGFPTGRYRADRPHWSCEATARAILADAGSALDMGTGEGGVLASLAPLPKLTVAHEGGGQPSPPRRPGFDHSACTS